MNVPFGRWPGRIAVGIVVGLIRVYQYTLSPVLSRLGPVCPYEPSCSRYMIGALRKYGLIRGLWKGTGRVLRCHPWSPGGFDPP